MIHPISLVIPCNLVKNANLHIEGYSSEVCISYEPPLTEEETGEVWLNKEKLGKLLTVLNEIYGEMDDE